MECFVVSVRKRLALTLAAVVPASVVIGLTGTSSARESTEPNSGSQNISAPSAHVEPAPTRPPVIGGPSAGADLLPPNGTSFFLDAYAYQFGTSNGAWTYTTVADPYLAPGDVSSAFAVGVMSADHKQAIEVGWIIGQADSHPEFFVYHWEDGKPTCFNGCGFHGTGSGFPEPGSVLASGGMREFGIEHADGRWYIGIDQARVGYFPDRLWGGRFTNAGLVYWFGQVQARSVTPCTDMGNGLHASSPSAATAKLGYFGGPGIDLTIDETNPALYSLQRVDVDTFRYGGSGAC
jgi:hypothetical protein